MDEESPYKKEASEKKHSLSLDALDFLATAAGQLKSDEHKRTFPQNLSTSVSTMDFLSMPQFALPSSTVFSPFLQGSNYSHSGFMTSFSNPYSSRFNKSDYDMKPGGFPIKSSTVKDLVDSCITSRSSPPVSQNPNFYMNSSLPNLCRMSSPSNIPSDVYKNSIDTVKSAFKVVQKTSDKDKSDDIDAVQQSNSTPCHLPEQPPKLFRMEIPETKGNSLFETLVKESQKILSSHHQNDISAMNSERESVIKEDVTSNQNSVISPKKVTKRRKTKGVVGTANDTKRAYGGPPFNPGASPPKSNTPESALCTLHEHTLLKMATRGFWSGDRGPLQDVFRLTRVENSDLQYSINDITEHCYNVVKKKLENVSHGSEERDVMCKHMRCYVDELDSYLERIYPVSSVAINIYLPTAMDYAAATWHGIVPTGWSEYRRAVVIREVFEVLFHLSANHSIIPSYDKKFFSKAKPDPTLYPTNLNTDTEECHTTDADDDSPGNMGDGGVGCTDIKYSRAFEALWMRTSPHEPFLLLHDTTTQLKLREYLEKYPVESNSPPENAIIVIDDKKYKARQILGFFRRGVQLVDYSKETGGMVVDTISTIRQTSSTSAVRKIPPGKISKLIHSDLHLENYTNAILQIGIIHTENSNDSTALPAVKHRSRKRRIKIGSSHNSEKKFKEEEDKSTTEENTLIPDIRKLDSIAAFCEPLQAQTDMKDVINYSYVSPASGSNVKVFSDQQFDETPYEQVTATETQRRHSASKKYWESFLTQASNSNFAKTKSEIPNYHTPDILQSMYKPPATPTPCNGDMFSLHLMIDSYRRAAKYLLDTANHLELVAKRGGNLSHAKRDEKTE